MLGRWPNPGMAQRQNPALQIPLHERFHTGQSGIDSGMGVYKSVAHWEAVFGEQTYLLDVTSRWLGYDVWKLAQHYESLGLSSDRKSGGSRRRPTTTG